MKPDLSLFHSTLADYARKSWREGDWTNLHLMLNSQVRGEFVMRNRDALRARGGYESMLFDAYLNGPHLHPMDWAYLFGFADFSKPDERWRKPTAPIVVYRGLRDRRHRKWIRGLSWTTNPATASWFANRFREPHNEPAVYSLTVDPENVYFQTNERREDEVVIASWSCGRLKRLVPMPEAVQPV